MRIIDEKKDEATNSIVMILTVTEASELRDKTKLLLARKAVMDHEHIDDKDYKNEITISIYDTQLIKGFHPRFQKLILEDT